MSEFESEILEIPTDIDTTDAGSNAETETVGSVSTLKTTSTLSSRGGKPKKTPAELREIRLRNLSKAREKKEILKLHRQSTGYVKEPRKQDLYADLSDDEILSDEDDDGEYMIKARFNGKKPDEKRIKNKILDNLAKREMDKYQRIRSNKIDSLEEKVDKITRLIKRYSSQPQKVKKTVIQLPSANIRKKKSPVEEKVPVKKQPEIKEVIPEKLKKESKNVLRLFD